FLRDVAVLGAVLPTVAAAESPRRLGTKGPWLWASSGGVIGRPVAADEPAIRAFAAQCANLGIARIIASDANPMLVAAGQAHGIPVWPYSQFNTHGGLNRVYQWSLDYTKQPLDRKRARWAMDHHRPTHWEHPPVLAIRSELAQN